MTTNNKREFRFTSRELRAASDTSRISGYAAVYNSPTNIGGDFEEVILPGAFRRTLAEGADVRALVNHDENLVLGRTASGTLRLREDSKGLFFECDLPDTSTANDLRTLIKRNDVNQCSFGFYAMAQNWVEQGSGIIRRELTDVELFDVSIVTYPAYSDTSVSARSLFPDGKPERNIAVERERERMKRALRLAEL